MPEKFRVYRPPGATASKAANAKRYESTEDRKAAKAFYNSRDWKRVRAYVLSRNPCCARCSQPMRPVAAVEVHHKQPRDVRPDLALDPDNCEGLCRICHRKARPEDTANRTSGGVIPRR